MPAKVFISYRRDDSKYQARMIYTAFCQVVAPENVFMDVDSIPPGANFRKILKGWVHECEVLLALIGPGWIDAIDPKTGQRRLDNSNDFVRIEIGEALARDIPVVPVLLDGAPMPNVDVLPDDMKELVDRQAEFVVYRTFDPDVARLIRKLRLDQTAAPATPVPPKPPSQPDEARMRAEGRVLVDAAIIENPSGRWFKPGAGKTEWFKDHEHGPEMVVVPAGSFTMGSPLNEPERESWLKGCESPQHKVTIAQPFAVGRHAVTRGQFAAFVNNAGHEMEGGADVWKGDKWEHDPNGSWRKPGFAQDDSHPVVCVDWDDANAYAAWLAQVTGRSYRLLTGAEREFVTRAGTATPFWWGSSVTPAQANYDGNHVYAGGGSKGQWRKATVPVGSFAANPWGLYNVHGNVWEWCEDVWHDTYDGAPTDGSAWLQGGEASRRVLRGGSWFNDPRYLRAANRYGSAAGGRDYNSGFRLARTLNP
jgi:formylglycine-generating enzyme required for sulfatase activity